MATLNYISETMNRSLREMTPVEIRGRVTQVIGTVIKAVVPGIKIGELVTLSSGDGGRELKAECVGFQGAAAILTPLGELDGVSSSTVVVSSGKTHAIGVGPELIGRVLDGLGNPLDGGPPITPETYYPVYAPPPPPMSRRPIATPMAMGVRALDGLLTCGEGQRLGIFAAAGGGKSTLLSCLVKGSAADVVVLALVGERGREVRSFIERDLGPEGMRRAVLVASTSDRPAMERLKASYVATAVAEYFRDQGRRVLLLMDSVTRFGRALREIGLASGEPPTRRGFPPSVFSSLPKLMERAGNSDKGSITAFYTVLVEGDDMTEPIADECRSILDGHIILSRQLAAANHYPAVDILASVSRCMNELTTPEHRAAAGRFRQLLAKYLDVELLVQIGEYKAGRDALADEAIAKRNALNMFLRQGINERTPFEETVSRMRSLVGV